MLLKTFRNIKIKEKLCLIKAFRRFISFKLKMKAFMLDLKLEI